MQLIGSGMASLHQDCKTGLSMIREPLPGLQG